MTVFDLPAGLRQVNPEVFIAEEASCFVTPQYIEFLKLAALRSEKKRSRICLHKDGDDPVHEMIIVVHKNSFVPPHAHPYKKESFHLIEGECDVLIFSKDGAIENTYPLKAMTGDTMQDSVYFYRVGPNVIHGMQIKTDWIVFHEVAAGPLKDNGNYTPEWVPEFDKAEDGIAWFADYIEGQK